MDQKTLPKNAKNLKNWSKIGPWALLGGSWGQLGDHLGPKSSQEPFGCTKSISLDPPWPPKMGPCWRVLGPCWGYVGRFWWQVGGQKAFLPSMKQKMAKDRPRWANIPLKNTILSEFWTPSCHQKLMKIGAKLINSKISKI